MALGYTNPIRNLERKLAPDYAQREFRDPGIRSMRSGLGSLRHTMPHLRNLSGTPHYQAGGGASDPWLSLYDEPSLTNNPFYDPDAQFRARLQAISQNRTSNPALKRIQPLSFPYQQGGPAPEDQSVTYMSHPDMQELESPDEEMSPEEQQQREIVLDAMAALDGQSPDPEGALKAFIDTFGPRALADLQQMVEQKHEDEQSGGEEDQIDMEGGPGDGQESSTAEAANELAGAGGGLLHGPGTGQSDEIEGETPSGHPVLLSDGEYVIDAPTVAALGDGSTDAGARRLDELRRQIRKDAWGNEKQAKPMARGGRAFTLRIP